MQQRAPTMAGNPRSHPVSLRISERAFVLLPKAQSGDECPVAVNVCPIEVGEMPASLADKLEQATPRVVVVLVDTEMLRQLVDSPGQESNLDIRRAGVAVVRCVFRDDLGLRFS